MDIKTIRRYCVIDTETTGVGWHDTVFLWAFCNCVVSEQKGSGEIHTTTSIPWVTWEDNNFVFHNAKFDLQKCLLHGVINPEQLRQLVVNKQLYDTYTMAALLNVERLGLKDLARDYLFEETDEAKEIAAARRKLKLTKDDGYDKLPIELVDKYAKKDVYYTEQLFLLLWPMLQARGLEKLYWEEIDLTVSLIEIEAEGLKVDREYLTEQIKHYGDMIYHATAELGTVVGKPVFNETFEIPREGETKKAAKERARRETFNPNSHEQIKEHVWVKYRVRLEATDQATMQEHSEFMPELAQILKLRKLQKIRSTYLLGIRREIKDDNILHPNFRQHGTRTGRMSSGEGT